MTAQAATPSDQIVALLDELYDAEGVAIWIGHWRNSDQATRARLEQSVHAMTDGAYL